MKKRTVWTILIAVAIISLVAIGSAVFYFTRTSINIVMTEAEQILFASRLPSGLSEGYRVRVSLYPETRKADYTLYSPAAGARAVADQADLDAESAVWGLSDENIPFALSFIPDESARWNYAYQQTGSPLLAAVIYDTSSPVELELAAKAPSSVLRFSYDGSLSRVGAENMKDELERNGVSSLIIYSPVNTLELLSSDEGYELTFPLLYADVFETVSPSYLAAEDFRSMFDILKSGQKGRVETPYTLLPAKKGIEVILDKLL